MNRKVITIILIIFSFFAYFAYQARASSLIKVSDRLSTSRPGSGSNHYINFITAHAIPASGSIVVRFDPDNFYMDDSFDYKDVDLALSDQADGPFDQRSLGPIATNVQDGISVVTGSSSSVTINLNSSDGIAEGKYVSINLGTNAVNEDQGDKQIYNPNDVGTYSVWIESINNGSQILDRAHVLVATVQPVVLTGDIVKIRFNGRPEGVLGHGTKQTLLSLTTNYRAICHFSNTPLLPYITQENTFSWTGSYYHSSIITGLMDGMIYNYYIKCRDELGIDDGTDYLIHFSVEAVGTGGADDQHDKNGSGGGSGGETGPLTGGGARAGGGGGGGGGGGSGSTSGNGQGEMKLYPEPIGNPDLSLAGLAYPMSKVYILKDGKVEKIVNADSKAAFSADINGLNEGVYTFSLKAEDTDSRKSPINAVTFWVRKGTKTNITDIYLPPTISLMKNTVSAKESFTAYGQSAPASKIEVWLYANTIFTPSLENVTKAEAIVGTDGKWQAIINTEKLAEGGYFIQARMYPNQSKYSNFGEILSCGIGQSGIETNCQRSDANKDSKINLTDFSILLFNWGKSGPKGDINKDGIVNLVDFSMMMFCWTG